MSRIAVGIKTGKSNLYCIDIEKQRRI